MPVGFELWIQRRNGNPIFCRANFSLRNMRPLAVVVSPEVFSLPLCYTASWIVTKEESVSCSLDILMPYATLGLCHFRGGYAS
jgi:hypothetical protein